MNGQLEQDTRFINPLVIPQYVRIGKDTNIPPQAIILTNGIPLGAL